jgi:hypothetical protein
MFLRFVVFEDGLPALRGRQLWERSKFGRPLLVSFRRFHLATGLY